MSQPLPGLSSLDREGWHVMNQPLPGLSSLPRKGRRHGLDQIVHGPCHRLRERARDASRSRSSRHAFLAVSSLDGRGGNDSPPLAFPDVSRSGRRRDWGHGLGHHDHELGRNDWARNASTTRTTAGSSELVGRQNGANMTGMDQTMQHGQSLVSCGRMLASKTNEAQTGIVLGGARLSLGLPRLDGPHENLMHIFEGFEETPAVPLRLCQRPRKFPGVQAFLANPSITLEYLTRLVVVLSVSVVRHFLISTRISVYPCALANT